MPTKLGKPPRRQKFDHGEPLSRASSLPILLFFTCLVLVGLTFNRIPVHVIRFDLLPPVTEWRYAPGAEVHLIAPKHDGSLEWNGEKVGTAELWQNLQAGLMQPVEPEIVFVPDGDASYDLSVKVLNIIKGSGVTKFCFGELERYKDFGKESPAYRLNLTLVNPEEYESFTPPLVGKAVVPPQCSDPLR